MAFVYIHKKKIDNNIFYVGMGKQYRRINSRDSRNRYWNNVVKKYDFISEVIEDGISWDQAQELEIFLIDLIGINSLTNIKLGGEGSLGIKPWNKGLKMNKKSNLENSLRIKKAYKTGKYDTDLYRLGRISQSVKISGENNVRAKLTKLKVLNIRNKYKNIETSYSKLAKEYNVSKGTIASIIKKRSWKL